MSTPYKIAGCDNAERVADIVFVHGLDGDAFVSWGDVKNGRGNDAKFWPKWLSIEFKNIGIWSVDYDAASLGWRGKTMPLPDRAREALSTLETEGIGTKPIIFVTHSMGGLVVKQLLRSALDSGRADFKRLASQTVGIVFLATPHAGSDVASWVDSIGTYLKGMRATVTLNDLRNHSDALFDLNLWFRNNFDDALGLTADSIEVLYETQPTFNLMVVNRASADPGIPKIRITGVDANHSNISKPGSFDSPVYRRVRAFIDNRLKESSADPQ